MTKWVLRVEGVNFDATIDDTNELSTKRGASLALLRLDTVVRAELAALELKCVREFSGASQCAFWFDASETEAEDLRKKVDDALKKAGQKSEPFPYLTFVVDIANDDDKQGVARAEARNHARQFRQWTLPPQPFTDRAKDADPFENVRPGTEESYLPKGKVLRPHEDPPDQKAYDPKTYSIEYLSKSVASRRSFGRVQRQRFYRDELGKERATDILGDPTGGLSFTNEFKDIVANPPDEVPLSLKSKIAVVYADGNKFGRIREEVPPDVFSRQLKTLRTGLLENILRWYARGAKETANWGDFAVRDDDKPTLGLRFETLLWGGDECAFVLPAWLVVPFVSGFFRTTAGWAIGRDEGEDKSAGTPLTHAVGVAIAHYKTPIRQLTRIAKEAADGAKDADLRDKNSVTFEIFESLAPPDTDLGPTRRRLYGVKTKGDAADKALAKQLAFPGDAFDTVVANMKKLAKGTDGMEPFPRSQIYGALRKASEAGDLTGKEAQDAIVGYLDTFAKRPEGKEHRAHLEAWRLPACLDGVTRDWAVELALITQLWDYADPLNGRVKPFGYEEAGE